MRSIARPFRANPAFPEKAGVTVVAIAALVLLTGYAPAVAAGQANGAKAVCHKVEEVKPAFFAKVNTTVFDFEGSDAAKLNAAFDLLTGGDASPVSATMHLVVVPDSSEFDAFFFGPDGCNTVVFVGLKYDDMAKVFDAAEVTPPPNLALFKHPTIAV